MLHESFELSGRAVSKVEAVDRGHGDKSKFDGALVLLAEDNRANQMLAELQLTEFGLNVHIANNGREAVDLYLQNAYDLILMDCQMPEMDGFEACRVIRRLETQTGKHVPMVAMTANAMKGDRETCIGAGMDDYLAKPVMFDALHSALNKWLPAAQASNVPALTSSLDSASDTSIDVYLTRMTEVFGAGVVSEMVNVFQSETKNGMSDLLRAIGGRDRVFVQQLAHKLKGSSATFRAHELAALFYKLEKDAESADWKVLEKLIDEAEAELHNMTEQCHAVGY
jgi:CheY-like chemotaxis protein/HPt (histidine-containing phosphotransfer) domain-containing protein